MKPRKPRKRRTADLYETPYWATLALLDTLFSKTPSYCPGVPCFLEPFSGGGKISNLLTAYHQGSEVTVNEPWPTPRLRADLGHRIKWTKLGDFNPLGPAKHVITNPPFSLMRGYALVEELWNLATESISLYLPLTWLNPSSGRTGQNSRGLWLREHPVSHALVLPRFAWAQESGKTQTHSVNHAWLTWDKTGGQLTAERPAVEVVVAPDLVYFSFTEDQEPSLEEVLRLHRRSRGPR